jgi:hypothetical protein
VLKGLCQESGFGDISLTAKPRGQLASTGWSLRGGARRPSEGHETWFSINKQLVTSTYYSFVLFNILVFTFCNGPVQPGIHQLAEVDKDSTRKNNFEKIFNE